MEPYTLGVGTPMRTQRSRMRNLSSTRGKRERGLWSRMHSVLRRFIPRMPSSFRRRAARNSQNMTVFSLKTNPKKANPKSEIRNKFKYPKRNLKTTKPDGLGHSDFEFGMCFGFRISDFG